MSQHKFHNRKEKLQRRAKIKKLCLIALAVILAGILLYFGVLEILKANRETPTQNAGQNSTIQQFVPPEVEDTSWHGEFAATHYAEIQVKDYGTIRLALCGEVAPKTVDNFVSLAQSGFYDGLTFHRIMSGFMIQGGDPEGTGYGGSENYLEGEFSANGFENPLLHRRGVISMARSGYDNGEIKAENSARSQFFIMQDTNTGLDGKYAAFGYVLEGMSVVDAIVADTVAAGYTEMVPAAKQPVITKITITEA